VDAVSHVYEVGTAGKPRQQGREDAVASLFVAHHRRLVGLASLLVDDRESAEDVVQDAFAGLYRRWRQLRDQMQLWRT
jgi:DNA-directed RNA polymerase specialized sigma24 family protein